MKKISMILLATTILITLVGCADDHSPFPVNQQPIESEITTKTFDDSNNNEADEESNMATTTSSNQPEEIGRASCRERV